MRSILMVWSVALIGCFSDPAPVYPGYPYGYPQPYPQQPYAQQPSPQQPYAQQPSPQQPSPQQPSPQQPYPQPLSPQQQPYAQQQPSPQQPSPQQPSAQQPSPQQPYPQQQPYAPQPPYPQQPYAPQPYPPPQGYPPPPYAPAVQPYAAAAPYAATAAALNHSAASREVTLDFAMVGALASIDLIVRQDVTNGSAGTLIVAAGVVGGGAAGWLLADRFRSDRGTGRTTTLGLLVGAANGALLIQPTGGTDADEVLGLLLLGSTVGALGGFAYGEATDLTAGQSTFVGNLALLGSSTAAFTAIAGSRDGEFGGWEDGALALGLDAGVIGGALIAPHLDWSARRAKLVLASTAVGAFAGGMLVGLITKRDNGSSSNGDLVAGCMTAGMWAGFGLGVTMTRDSEPDIRFNKASRGTSVSVAPFAGDRGEVGLAAGGSW
jgi:hypothetical protein